MAVEAFIGKDRTHLKIVADTVLFGHPFLLTQKMDQNIEDYACAQKKQKDDVDLSHGFLYGAISFVSAISTVISEKIVIFCIPLVKRRNRLFNIYLTLPGNCDLFFAREATQSIFAFSQTKGPPAKFKAEGPTI